MIIFGFVECMLNVQHADIMYIIKCVVMSLNCWRQKAAFSQLHNWSATNERCSDFEAFHLNIVRKMKLTDVCYTD